MGGRCWWTVDGAWGVGGGRWTVDGGQWGLVQPPEPLLKCRHLPGCVCVGKVDGGEDGGVDGGEAGSLKQVCLVISPASFFFSGDARVSGLLDFRASGQAADGGAKACVGGWWMVRSWADELLD